MNRGDFIDKAWKAASSVQKAGARISVPIVVAQAALESNFGTSGLALKDNNLFGVKGEYEGKFSLYDTREQLPGGAWVTIQAKFRSYPSWVEAYDDYASIIERLPWYRDAADASHIPRDFLKGLLVLRDVDGKLVEPGWATDKNYFNKVWGIVTEYNLLDKQEELPKDEFLLLQVYDGDRRVDLIPLKHTIGGLANGSGMKLMVRVKPTTFWQRFSYLIGREWKS